MSAGVRHEDVAKVVVKAGTKDIVAPRVKVTPGKPTTLKLLMKNGQLVLESLAEGDPHER